MASNRLEVLQSLVEQNPSDAFSRFGLAMEYVNAGDAETAVDHFLMLLDHNPGYAAGYFHGGQTLAKLGRVDEAKGLFRRGLELTTATGDDHTASELQAALDALG